MVEVFKTNVKSKRLANKLVDELHRVFDNCEANFDLDDCDRILRIKCNSGIIDCLLIIEFLTTCGCVAEILEDEAVLDSFSFNKKYN